MPIAVHSRDYFAAARERATQAGELRRAGHFPLAMYVAGLAAECMLRAYHRADAEFDERHDMARLAQNCDFDRLGPGARAMLRGPMQTVQLLWQNRYRFFSEERLRAHVRSLGQERRGVQKGADFLKVRCKELEDACLQIVTLGTERWQ